MGSYPHQKSGKTHQTKSQKKKTFTLPKTNMEPKNGGLEDDFPFQMGDFQVSMLVFGGV